MARALQMGGHSPRASGIATEEAPRPTCTTTAGSARAYDPRPSARPAIPRRPGPRRHRGCRASARLSWVLVARREGARVLVARAARRADPRRASPVVLVARGLWFESAESRKRASRASLPCAEALERRSFLPARHLRSAKCGQSRRQLRPARRRARDKRLTSRIIALVIFFGPSSCSPPPPLSSLSSSPRSPPIHGVGVGQFLHSLWSALSS